MSLRERFVDVWNDPVWSKVIAGAIMAALSWLAFRILGWLPSHSHDWWNGPIVVAIGIGLAGAILLVVWSTLRQPRKTLVFLSSGGTCRDPMAKAITTKLLETRRLKHAISVRAVGLRPTPKSKVSYAARYAIREMYNQDLLKRHRPRQLTPRLIEEADLILAMDRSLLVPSRDKTRLPPEKTHVLKEFFGRKGDVDDPWPDGKDQKTLARYRRCAEELRGLLTDNFDRLASVLDT
jgi:protein-tyrosine-phosphatase